MNATTRRFLRRVFTFCRAVVKTAVFAPMVARSASAPARIWAALSWATLIYLAGFGVPSGAGGPTRAAAGAASLRRTA
ncbi:hypothetical protein ABIB17_003087 [Arthrobacter sp. UYEF6]